MEFINYIMYKLPKDCIEEYTLSDLLDFNKQ